MMKTNESLSDRVTRIALGVGSFALTMVGPQTLWGLLGFVPLITGLIGYCPLYQLLGVSTCPRLGSDLR